MTDNCGANEKDSTKLETMVVNVKTLCDLFGVTEQYLGRLVKKEILIRCGRGQYPLVENIRRFCAHLRSRHEDTTIDGNLSQRDRLAKAQREKIELEMAEKKRLLIPLPLAESVFADVITKIRTRFLSFPALVAPLVTEVTTTDASVILNEKLHEILIELATPPQLPQPIEEEDTR